MTLAKIYQHLSHIDTTAYTIDLEVNRAIIYDLQYVFKIKFCRSICFVYDKQPGKNSMTLI